MISRWSERLVLGSIVVVMLAGLSSLLCVLFAPLYFFPFPANLVGIAAAPAIFLLSRFLTGQNTIETLVVLGVIGILMVLLAPAAREAGDKNRREGRARHEQTGLDGVTPDRAEAQSAGTALSMYGDPN